MGVGVRKMRKITPFLKGNVSALKVRYEGHLDVIGRSLSQGLKQIGLSLEPRNLLMVRSLSIGLEIEVCSLNQKGEV